MAWSIVIGALLSGALAGPHCLAMCGGFVTAFGAHDRAGSRPLLSSRQIVFQQTVYNLGRVSTYVVLGALAGSLGGAALDLSRWLPLQRGLYVIANLALLALAWSLFSGGQGSRALQAAGARLFARVQPALPALGRRSSMSGRYAVGLVWGLVPCAITYSVLPLALFSGGAWQGALVMLAFGAGTLPNLLAAGWLAGRLSRLAIRPTVRMAAAGLLVAFAVVGIWRAFGDPAALAQGPFCLVP